MKDFVKLGQRAAAKRLRAREAAKAAKLRAAKAARKVKRKGFTGKLTVNREGLKAIDRKYTDQKAWTDRRLKEQPPPGGWPKPPKHWPPGVRVDLGRPVWWLPPGWGQGVKTTCATKLLCFISPEGKRYYHRHVVEQVSGVKFKNPPPQDKRPHSLEWTLSRAKMVIAQAQTFQRKTPTFAADEKLFKNLSKHEQRFIPPTKGLYFAVVSARRATDDKGVRNITIVEAQLRAAGVRPVWYVDKPSLAAYKALGLNAKVGGKLVPARNKALSDAARAKKACVQISDDISSWTFYKGDMEGTRDIVMGNHAARAADRLRISPVAAARFLVAKMRAASAGGRDRGPKIAGVFPLSNTGQAFSREGTSMDHFILGDFFVADPCPVRFDPKFTLKEDYDYTCSHLARYGSVLRCNRMFISAIHETNNGGAVSERDSSGDRERQMIKLLQAKWPGVFWKHPSRGDTQVIMSWKRRKLGR